MFMLSHTSKEQWSESILAASRRLSMNILFHKLWLADLARYVERIQNIIYFGVIDSTSYI